MLNAEFSTLSPDRQEVVRRLVRKVRAEGGNPTEVLSDGSDAYAYVGWQGVSWGINSAKNHGFCEARGVWPAGEKA
jgi:hypothetical protein